MAAPMDREMSNQQGQKTCSVIDHITCGGSFCVECNKISDDNVICAVTNGTERVYLYEGNERKVGC